MSKIILEFQEYQEIRDSMAFARGVLTSRAVKADYAIDRLREAGETLETARWRDPDWDKPELTFWQQVWARMRGRS